MLSLAHRVVAEAVELGASDSARLEFSSRSSTKTRSRNGLQRNALSIVNEFGVNGAGQRIGLKLEDAIFMVT